MFQTHFTCVINRLDLLFCQFLPKKSKVLPTAAIQLQNNYATKLPLSDLNLTLKILPPNLTRCFLGYPFQYHSKTIIWDWEITVP